MPKQLRNVLMTEIAFVDNPAVPTAFFRFAKIKGNKYMTISTNDISVAGSSSAIDPNITTGGTGTSANSTIYVPNTVTGTRTVESTNIEKRLEAIEKRLGDLSCQWEQVTRKTISGYGTMMGDDELNALMQKFDQIQNYYEQGEMEDGVYSEILTGMKAILGSQSTTG